MHIDQAALSGNKNSHHQEASRQRPRANNGGTGATSNPALSSDVKAASGSLQCEECGNAFTPRESGGRAQRFCSPDCRRAFHDKPQRDNVHVASGGLPAVVDPQPPKSSASAPKPSEGFDWVDDDSIILRHQPSVAAYIGQGGHLVIRQERQWDEEADTIICIAPESINTFIDKLTDAVGIPSFGKP
jgi:hypothetical protein